MRTKFDEQLEQLHIELIKMGSLCEEAISLSARILDGISKEDVERVSVLEHEIDQMERDIETRCIRLLLHQQPVARDLRAISAALKMISDLERIGDQAADISELAPYIADSTSQSKTRIKEMAAATVSMVTDSIEAFVKGDLAMTSQVMEKDDVVDDYFEKIKGELIELIYRKEIGAEAGLDLLMTAKYFERIGDHAVNVAEWVEFSITGTHKSSDLSEDL